MSAPERTEAEMAERIAAFEAAPAAPESLIERVAIALMRAEDNDWEWLWKKEPAMREAYHRMAQAAVNVIKADQP